MARLDTDYGTLKELMSGAKIYTVPPFQRRYSWKAKNQVAELWGDIVRLYRHRLDSPDTTPTHFMITSR